MAAQQNFMYNYFLSIAVVGFLHGVDASTDVPSVIMTPDVCFLGVDDGIVTQVTCTHDHPIPVTTISWFKENEEVSRNSDESVFQTILSGTLSTIIFGILAEPNDTAIYTCEITTPSVVVSRDLEVYVLGPLPERNLISDVINGLNVTSSECNVTATNISDIDIIMSTTTRKESSTPGADLTTLKDTTYEDGSTAFVVTDTEGTNTDGRTTFTVTDTEETNTDEGTTLGIKGTEETNTGLIVGLVIGGLVIISLAVGAYFYCKRGKMESKNVKQILEGESTTTNDGVPEYYTINPHVYSVPNNPIYEEIILESQKESSEKVDYSSRIYQTETNGGDGYEKPIDGHDVHQIEKCVDVGYEKPITENIHQTEKNDEDDYQNSITGYEIYQTENNYKNPITGNDEVQIITEGNYCAPEDITIVL